MWKWITIVISLAALIFYESYLRSVARRTPLKSATSAHAAARRKWVQSVMSRPGMDLVVVQTLRNSVMAASFMATTAVLALSAMLTLSGVGSTTNTLWQSIRTGNEDSLVFAFTLLLLGGTFFISFLFLAMAVRFFNHVGYLITGESSMDGAPAIQPLAMAYLNRAGNYYGFGLRTFFACIPFLAGLFSTYLMLPAALGLIAILHWFDRVPPDEQSSL